MKSAREPRRRNKVVTRYPLSIRCGVVLITALLAFAIARGSATTGAIVVGFGSACLSIVLLAYRAEVSPTEIRVRYLPFYARKTPIRDVSHLAEGKTLVLVTATSRIPLWGLSMKTRESLFEILPRHLEVMAAHRNRRTDAAADVRRNGRRTILVPAAFVVSLGLSIPFLNGNPWHSYVDMIGKYIAFFCLVMFLLLLFQAGFTYVLWSSQREFEKIAREQHSHRHSSRPAN